MTEEFDLDAIKERRRLYSPGQTDFDALIGRVEQQRVEIAALGAEVERLTKRVCRAHASVEPHPVTGCVICPVVEQWDKQFCEAMDEDEKQIDALRARCETLAAALRTHGEHRASCAGRIVWNQCDCGLRAVLADAEPECGHEPSA